MDKIYLWENETPYFDESIGQERPSITPYLVDDGQVHGAMIVAPGGAYMMKAEHEGAPIAQRLNELGIHAFVLDYRVAPYHMPVMLEDAQRAIRLVRYLAKEYRVDAQHVGIMGFSAGGHLTGMCGTHWDMGYDRAPDPVERMSSRPDAIAPCYGALNINRTRSAYFNENMTGKREVDIYEARAYSPEYHISPATPPTFLWHTAADPVVPVELSIEFAQRCADCNVPVELHVYPFGPHGIGLGSEQAPGADSWSGLLGAFLKHHGF